MVDEESWNIPFRHDERALRANILLDFVLVAGQLARRKPEFGFQNGNCHVERVNKLLIEDRLGKVDCPKQILRARCLAQCPEIGAIESEHSRSSAQPFRRDNPSATFQYNLFIMSISLVSNAYLDDSSTKIRVKPVPWEVPEHPPDPRSSYLYAGIHCRDTNVLDSSHRKSSL